MITSHAPSAKEATKAPTDATRHLCAGVYVDERFRDLVINEVCTAPHRRVAPSYGFDIVPVMRHAWRAAALSALARATVVGAAVIPAFVGALPTTILVTCGLTLLWLLHFAMSLRISDDAPRVRRRSERHGLGATREQRSLLKLIVKYSGRLKYAEKARAYRLIGAAAFALLLTSLVTAALHPDRAAEALYLAGAIAVTYLSVGAARQLMLNRLMRAPVLRPKRLSRRQRVADAQQHDVYAVYRRPRHSEDDDDLTRFTLFGEESPFIGAGELVYQWNPPMCLQLLRPGDEKTPLHEREYLEPPFEAYELVDHLREAVEQLDTDTGDIRLPTRVGHRIYITETDVAADRNLLPSRIEEVDIRLIINTPGCKQHHFLEITTAIEGAEFVAIVLLHVSLRGRTLSISTAACVLSNTPRSFQRTAEFGQNGAIAVTWEAFRQLSTLPEEIQRSWRITRYLFALSKAALLPRDLTSAPIRNVLIGTRVSAREKASQSWSKIQLEKTELLGRMKTIEQRLLGAASDFLREKYIDVSEFDDRALKIINSGIIAFGDNNNFNNNAVGTGSQVGDSGNQPVGPNAQGSGGSQ